MRLLLISAILIVPSAAVAHPGHLAGVAGHDHWVAGIAIGTAIAIGLWGAFKGEKSDSDAEAVDDDSEETQEA